MPGRMGGSYGESKECGLDVGVADHGVLRSVTYAMIVLEGNINDL